MAFFSKPQPAETPSGESIRAPTDHFIPLNQQDLVALLLDEHCQDSAQREQLHAIVERIDGHFRDEFHAIGQTLKASYAPVDPDRDTEVRTALTNRSIANDTLPEALSQLLTRGNYRRVDDDQLQRALRSASLFQVRLVVDMEDFEDVLLFTRGGTQREEIVSELFGLWKRKVSFINYDRVVLYLRVKNTIEEETTLSECPPGSTLIKLFQNVPEADLEMLFPNIRVGMRWLDKLMIGVPAIISGAIVITTKMGTTLLLLASLIGFWIGTSQEAVTLDKAAIIAVLASLGALGGYLWKQFSNFRNRRLKYQQALTQNLYFKLLDNNTGAILRVLDNARESECKEAILAYACLQRANEPLTQSQLDTAIEQFLSEQLNRPVDFDAADALHKLQSLQLAAADDQGLWGLSHQDEIG